MNAILKTVAIALVLNLGTFGIADARDGSKSAGQSHHGNKHDTSTGGSGTAGTGPAIDTGGGSGSIGTSGNTTSSGTAGTGPSIDTGSSGTSSYDGSGGGVTGGSAETSFDPAGN
jgi:hypothetical protein